jgi:hypothetical protein
MERHGARIVFANGSAQKTDTRRSKMKDANGQKIDRRDRELEEERIKDEQEREEIWNKLDDADHLLDQALSLNYSTMDGEHVGRIKAAKETIINVMDSIEPR